jgi:hypothetical protein
VFALDVLYLPVLQNFVLLIFTTRISNNEVYQLTRDPTVSAFDFVYPQSYRNATCPDINQICNLTAFCSEKSSLRLQADLSLGFSEDIIRPCIFLILYVAICFAIGISVIMYFLIKRNQSYICAIKVFGLSRDHKWFSILNRLCSTGIDLFDCYKFSNTKWEIIVLFMKFLLTVLTTISTIILQHKPSLKPFIISVPIFYLVFFFLTFRMRPFVNNGNNIIEIALVGLNFVSSILAVIEDFDSHISSTAFLIIGLSDIAIPLMSIIYFLCLGKSPK